MKNSMSSYRSNTLDKVSQINNSINSLKTLTNTNILFDSNSNLLLSKEENIKNNELSIEKQELSIKNEEKNYSDTIASYELIIKTKKQDIENNKTSLELTNINLEELLEWPTDDNIAKANNSIKQAKIRLETAYENLEDYLLEAPFDWVISKIDYMVWDNLINDTSKYVYIENPNLLEISVMLDQIDIVTVELNQEAIVTFDTYPTIPVKAKVYSIDTTPVKSSWVVSYEVKLVLDDSSFDKKILSWMTADLEIITESVENVIIIKTSAIKEKNKINHVTVLENWKEVQKEVEVWISSNWMSEIISWLSKWDKIIIDEFVTSSTWENKSNSSSLFPGWWMWWWNRQGMWWWNR